MLALKKYDPSQNRQNIDRTLPFDGSTAELCVAYVFVFAIFQYVYNFYMRCIYIYIDYMTDYT